MNAKPAIRIIAADFTREADANIATLSFNSGDEMQLDFGPVIRNRKRLSPLSSSAMFASAKMVDGGIAIEWKCGIDMDAETLLREANIQAGNSIRPAGFRDWRRRWRLNQVECASALGISRRTVQLYESGELPVPKTIVLAMRGYEALLAEAAA